MVVKSFMTLAPVIKVIRNYGPNMILYRNSIMFVTVRSVTSIQGQYSQARPETTQEGLLMELHTKGLASRVDGIKRL